MGLSSRRSRISAVGAMAVLWAFFFNARLFPVSLADEPLGSLAPLSLYMVYGLTFVAAGLLAIFLEMRPMAGQLRRAGALAGCLVGLTGAFMVVFPYGDLLVAPLLIGVGVGCMALFLVAQFWYWTAALRRRDVAEALTDAAIGLALFCACSAPAALLHAESPIALALLPLISFVCTLASPVPSEDEPQDLGRPLPAEGDARPSSDLGSGLSRRLVRRLLIPSVLYLYLVQAMNVSLDLVTLLPIADFRPWVFVFAVLGAAALVFALLVPGDFVVKRLARGFNIVSACLLTALFVTCCQTMGLLPVGNYAVIAAKILLCFFIWVLLLLRPAEEKPSARCSLLLLFYLVFILWVPNLIQSLILAVPFGAETPDQLSWLFIVLLGIALVVSIGSNVVISSLVPSRTHEEGPKAVENELAESKGDAEMFGLTPGSGEGEARREGAIAWLQSRHGLSEREAEITRLACEGKTAKRIARELYIAESTVYTHLKHIYRKAGVHSRQELVDLVELTATKSAI